MNEIPTLRTFETDITDFVKENEADKISVLSKQLDASSAGKIAYNIDSAQLNQSVNSLKQNGVYNDHNRQIVIILLTFFFGLGCFLAFSYNLYIHSQSNITEGL